MTLPPGHDLSDDPADEFQGDVHAADIVSPTGEEMPVATHAEVHRPPGAGVLRPFTSPSQSAATADRAGQPRD